MEEAAVRQRIKEIVSNVANIPIAEIGDHDSLREDLDLDSLSLLEIGVEVDYSFKLGLPEERLNEIADLDGAVAVVLEALGGRRPQAAAGAA